jgi:hypothetical protein
MPLTFLGLDGEMTSGDLAAGGRLIQIGLAVGEGGDERVTELIGWDRGDFHADPVAMEVHGIPEATILAAPRADEVDERLFAWCLAHGGSTEKRVLVPVGWNVGAFDLPFVRHTLPRTFRLLSRRTVDLNAVCFTLGGATTVEGSRPKWTGWKRMAKRAAEERLAALGIEPAWHDAGYDALASLAAFRWMRERISSLGPPPPSVSGGISANP